METVAINYKGINRAVPSQLVQDGWLDEFTNLRHRDGRLQPVGNPTKLYEIPTVLMPENISDWTGFQWLKIWKHEQDNINNFVGLQYFIETVDETEIANRQLRLIDMAAGTFTAIKDYTAHGNIQVEFIKRFMVVIYDGSGGTTGAGMDRFIWKDGAYILVDINVRPQFSVYTSETKVEWDKTLPSSIPNSDIVIPIDGCGEDIRGEFYDVVNTQAGNSFFTGGIFVRAAFRLFDGSYILHTIPQFIAVNDLAIGFQWAVSLNKTNVIFKIGATFAKLNVIIPTELYGDFTNLSEIISDIVIFASKAETIIKMDEDIDDELETKINSAIDGITTLNAFISTVNPDYKDLHDSPSWYKIAEYPLSQILEADVNEEIDLTDFYQDYATREVLPVDNFTHHELAAGTSFNYNSRLAIGDVKTRFGDYKQFPLSPILDGTEFPNLAPAGYVNEGNKDIKLLVTLDTDSGTIKKLGQTYQVSYYSNVAYPGALFLIVALGEIGYPDERATKIEILYDDNGSNFWYKIGLINLKKSKYDNFAYYILDNFTTAATAHVTGTANYPVIIHRFTGYTPVNILSYPDTEYQDSNRVQLSELNNPFYFPAENSYQAGTGRVLAIAANTEPLSGGQFGEYPLTVFTSKGVWSMFQGQGDVLFSSVKPLNGDVPNNPDQIVPIGTGVIYTTGRGMYLISGANVQELSGPLVGSPNTDLQGVANFLLRINHIQLVQLGSSLSSVSTMLVLSGAKIGYNKYHNEIIVSNPDYQYSYIYSFESQVWSKISRSYTTLINSYPSLLGIAQYPANDGVYDLTEEQFSTNIETLIVTRPCKIDKFANFNLIHRAIQRCEIETPTSFYAGFYVFGSNDLKTWQLLQGY